MMKKIRFTLEMADGVQVSKIEELRENFSLGQIFIYLENGKLVTWLNDRYLTSMAAQVEELDLNDEDLVEKICTILDVEFDPDWRNDIENIKMRNLKLQKLREFTTDKNHLNNVELVAFEQDDIYDLLDAGNNIIYLCDNNFSIPLDVQGISYYGICNPIATIDAKEEVDWEAKKIHIADVVFDEKYEKILQSNRAKEKEKWKEEFENTKEKEIAPSVNQTPQKMEASQKEAFYAFEQELKKAFTFQVYAPRFLCLDTDIDLFEIASYDGKDSMGFSTRSECENVAQSRLSTIRNRMEKVFCDMVSKSSTDSSILYMERQLLSKIDCLKDAIPSNISSANANLVEQILNILSGNTLMDTIYNESDKRLNQIDRPYASDFYSEIEYDEDDGSDGSDGFWSKFTAWATTYYGFYAHDALNSMEERFAGLAREYADSIQLFADNEYKKQIANPIKDICLRIK